MATLPGKLHTTIQLTVVAVFLLATILTATLAIGLQYYFGQSMAKQSATNLYSTTSASITAELVSINRVNTNILDILADNPVLADSTRRPVLLNIFTRILEKNPLYYGIYLGRGDGSFFEVINLNASDQARHALAAVPSDRWVIIQVNTSAQGSRRQYEYLDDSLQLRVSRQENTDYDVRKRPWYTAAMSTAEIAGTPPYLFAQLGVPGRTLSRRIGESDTVVAIDMTMSSISEFLHQQAAAGNNEIYLYNGDGEIIASSVEDRHEQPQLPIPRLVLTAQEQRLVNSLPTLRVSNELDWPPFDYAEKGQPQGYSIDVIKMIAAMTGLKVRFVNGYDWPELASQFQNGDIDLLHSVILTENNSNWGLYGSSYTSLPYAVVTKPGREQITSLSQLEGQSLAIPSGWSIIPLIRSQFSDINILESESTLDALKMVVDGKVDAALDNEAIIAYVARHYFVDGLQYHSGISFGDAEPPIDLHIVVPTGQSALRALIDKAIAALGEQQRRYLAEKWLSSRPGVKFSDAGGVPSETLVNIAASPELHGQLTETQVAGEPVLVYAAPAGGMNENPLYIGILSPLATVIAPFLDKVKLSIAITSLFLFMLLPLSWLFAKPIVRPVRQLAIENDKVRRREYDQVERISSRVKELDELSESMVNMVTSIQAHELAQRELMDSFIKLIAAAIDDKSSYTGGHCARVPELALMLANRASASPLPAFESFKLNSDDEWREYRIAAWLHDCGKITTPEHIVDKGSKLEVIYNRLHEVRMRFEVLWRDAEINYWKQLIQNPNDKHQLERALEAERQQLLADFEFVAESNVGGEYMDDSRQARLREIAKVSWQRHFSDRIGLSPVEELRIDEAEPALPVTEQLLSDKPEHIIARTHSTEYPPEFGINMEIPQYLYNQGEVYNLSVSRGTLTAEDRFKINEHMISTIKMLESLPFPEELKNVPRYASTHHETMRGSGYPRRLPGAKLSIPERILAVADIFEALTAADRPYKKAKPVSVALDILYQMVQDEHVDRDCFELFVREGVYLEYAEAFLAPDQNDFVDVGRYLGERINASKKTRVYS
jgi:HD-GYP domain-containing protein (c-di-GMP phosphodiesterase class II)/ABC-type amino acid transport substrate-binding protein